VKSSPPKLSLAACLAEFLAMTLFVILGCGSAMGIAGSGGSGGSGETGGGADKSGETTSVIPGWVLMVALVFGLSITLLAYTVGHYSGGHINCAVTFGLVLTGHCSVVQGLGNFASQMCGTIVGAAILLAIYPAENDMTHSLASNSVGPRWHWWNALIGEVVGTFILMTVVLQTACNPKSLGNRANACIAIGLAVFAAHAVLIPIDGCSINPTRSFGPALLALSRREAPVAAPPVPVAAGGTIGAEVATMTTAAPVAADTKKPDAAPGPWVDMWIFWVGPLLGAALASGVYKIMLAVDDRGDDKEGEKSAETQLEEGGSRPRLLGHSGPDASAATAKSGSAAAAGLEAALGD